MHIGPRGKMAAEAGPSSVVLASALAAGEFVAYLQPQVDLALARWEGADELADEGADMTECGDRQRLAVWIAISALYQPIRYRDHTLGVLAIAWNQPHTHLPSELKSAIALVALSAAPLFHNVRAAALGGRWPMRAA